MARPTFARPRELSRRSALLGGGALATLLSTRLRGLPGPQRRPARPLVLAADRDGDALWILDRDLFAVRRVSLRCPVALARASADHFWVASARERRPDGAHELLLCSLDGEVQRVSTLGAHPRLAADSEGRAWVLEKRGAASDVPLLRHFEPWGDTAQQREWTHSTPVLGLEPAGGGDWWLLAGEENPVLIRLDAAWGSVGPPRDLPAGLPRPRLAHAPPGGEGEPWVLSTSSGRLARCGKRGRWLRWEIPLVPAAAAARRDGGLWLVSSGALLALERTGRPGRAQGGFAGLADVLAVD